MITNKFTKISVSILLTIGILTGILTISAFTSTGTNIPSIDEKTYVYDETGSLPSNTILDVENINETLQSNYGAEVYVVFINYFGDVYADEYAVSLFNEWEISNNGMLLVVSPREKRGGITVGADIESQFPDDTKSDYLERYFWDNFDAGKYDKAVTTLVSKLAEWYKTQYVSSDEASVETNAQQESSFDGSIIFLAIFVLILPFYAYCVDRWQHREYYTALGESVPRYHFWFVFSDHPYKHYYPESEYKRHYYPQSGHRGQTTHYSGRIHSYNGSVRRSSSRSSRSSGGHSGGGFGGRR